MKRRPHAINLSSPIVRLAIVGTITTQGRLDLEAAGSSGRVGANPAFHEGMGELIALASSQVPYLKSAGVLVAPTLVLFSAAESRGASSERYNSRIVIL